LILIEQDDSLNWKVLLLPSFSLILVLLVLSLLLLLLAFGWLLSFRLALLCYASIKIFITELTNGNNDTNSIENDTVNITTISHNNNVTYSSTPSS
jgi:hypothetical protein